VILWKDKTKLFHYKDEVLYFKRIMNEITNKLQKTIQLKKEAIAELFSLQILQTEFEYDFALSRLEFRYDDEIDFTLYEARITVITQELRELDAMIAQTQENISYYSHLVSTI
jgi:hypothetical protein